MHTHISVSTALYKQNFLYFISIYCPHFFFFFSLVEHASNTKLKKMLYLQHNETEDL